METERLVLRPFCLDDAEQLYELAKDPDVGIHAGWPAHTSLENSKDILENILIKENSFAIVLKETNKLIGAIALDEEKKRSNPEVKMMGYWIGKDYWGYGYMSEAGRRVLDYAFEDLGLSGVAISHYTENERSKSVIRKLGFEREGTLKQSAKRFDGKILDEVIYFMTKENKGQKEEKNEEV